MSWLIRTQRSFVLVGILVAFGFCDSQPAAAQTAAFLQSIAQSLNTNGANKSGQLNQDLSSDATKPSNGDRVVYGELQVFFRDAQLESAETKVTTHQVLNQALQSTVAVGSLAGSQLQSPVEFPNQDLGVLTSGNVTANQEIPHYPMGFNPNALGFNPNALGFNPNALGFNPNDVGYQGPGDMRTHLWNDHSSDLKSQGIDHAALMAMEMSKVQKWHNFFHGTEGLPQ